MCPLRNLADEWGRLRPFVPPFRFTDFFAPEDTLLCLLAAECAAARASRAALVARPLRIVELTAGSGLVGLALLRADPLATLLGVDVDAASPVIARGNACVLGLGNRSRFVAADLWDQATERLLAGESPDLVICNPPYIPEPPGEPGAREAGAGADGADHLRRVIALVDQVHPSDLVLSWCSLSDPAGIVADAEAVGYRLRHLDVVAIADGEYSGRVLEYLRALPTAFLSEARASIAAVAPDGAATFAYLLMAGCFEYAPAEPAGAADAVDRLANAFEADGIDALADSRPDARPDPGAGRASWTTRTWQLDRWGELALRIALHG